MHEVGLEDLGSFITYRKCSTLRIGPSVDCLLRFREIKTSNVCSFDETGEDKRVARYGHGAYGVLLFARFMI